jgi:hypothetical protein
VIRLRATRLRRDGSAYGQEKLRVAGNWWRVCGGKFVVFLGIATGLRGREEGGRSNELPVASGWLMVRN